MHKVPKQRIFIECTSTFFNGGNGGIQRVVRNLTNNSKRIEIEGLRVRPLIWTGFGFCQPHAQLTEKQYFLIRLKKAFQRFLRGTNLPLRYRDNFRKKMIDLPYSVLGFFAFPSQYLLGRSIHLRKGDIIVMVDSTWRSPEMLEALLHAQAETGVILGVMLHDLFPLVLPETCQEITIKGYVSWFNKVIPSVDFVVTNSEATRHALEGYLAKHKKIRRDPVVNGSFRLGAELDQIKNGGKGKEAEPLKGAKGRLVLCVGTIEPRKNHAYLLDAFDILRDEGEDVTLIIVGRPGWKNEEIIARIQQHQEFNTRLLHLSNASDDELSQIIERADCLVCPSLAEGFGLPVAECLMYGKKVFASDIEVFHEIGGGKCVYFDLNSPRSLADALQAWFAELDAGKQVNNQPPFVWPDWKESTYAFIELTCKLVKEAKTLKINAG